MKRADNSAPQKRRHARSVGPASGGVEGKNLRSRISKLRTDFKLSARQFAKLCGVDSRRMTDWEVRGRPDAGSLHIIAEKTRVSIDWLLGFDVPMYRGQSRDPATLEHDVGSHVMREVKNRAHAEPWAPALAFYDADGVAALSQAIERELALIRADWRHREVIAREFRLELHMSASGASKAEHRRRENELMPLLDALLDRTSFIGREGSILKQATGPELVDRFIAHRNQRAADRPNPLAGPVKPGRVPKR